MLWNLWRNNRKMLQNNIKCNSTLNELDTDFTCFPLGPSCRSSITSSPYQPLCHIYHCLHLASSPWETYHRVLHLWGQSKSFLWGFVSLLQLLLIAKGRFTSLLLTKGWYDSNFPLLLLYTQRHDEAIRGKYYFHVCVF